MTNLPTLTTRGGPSTFAWGCCIQDLHFLYVYGSQADYRAFCERDSLRRGLTLHKGRGASLAEVQGLAEAAAVELGVIYADVGSVGVAAAREQMAQRAAWPPAGRQLYHPVAVQPPAARLVAAADWLNAPSRVAEKSAQVLLSAP